MIRHLPEGLLWLDGERAGDAFLLATNGVGGGASAVYWREQSDTIHSILAKRQIQLKMYSRSGERDSSICQFGRGSNTSDHTRVTASKPHKSPVSQGVAFRVRGEHRLSGRPPECNPQPSSCYLLFLNLSRWHQLCQGTTIHCQTHGGHSHKHPPNKRARTHTHTVLIYANTISAKAHMTSGCLFCFIFTSDDITCWKMHGSLNMC